MMISVTPPRRDHVGPMVGTLRHHDRTPPAPIGPKSNIHRPHAAASVRTLEGPYAG